MVGDPGRDFGLQVGPVVLPLTDSARFTVTPGPPCHLVGQFFA